ncbi:MAG: serine/threonine-protein kinase [Microcella sp.]|uniref:serine/threonine-protein kinase n=1 Tax=Microcella sp. TaxID=1913979 RepID=UPI002726C621|nr:serine/threonine-protein kinase [Microcella sp.]MDO8337380.1 serine/threonine-protein kinase [Microcella sp.]
MRRAPSTPPALPGYEFVRLLGAGGFSDVFLYEQQLPRRQVAVKVLLADGLDSGARAAFVDEANLMARLSAHPSIVTIFHADIAPDDRPFFVMEYCSGPSLSEQAKRAPFSVVDALRTGVRLVGAVATAHAAGILHRDIKPANVLTNDYGWPALTDFGISSSVIDEAVVLTTTLSELRGGSSTESQSVGMSVPWSPPEMFADRPQPDVRSDVFSLAATLHTLLAGRTPFEIPGRPNGALDLIGRIERGAITPLPRDDVPASLQAVLRKGMATNPADRYATAVEFGRALQRVELELGYASTPLDVPAVVEAPPEREEAGAGDETRVRGVTVIAPIGPAAVPAGHGSATIGGGPGAPASVPGGASAVDDATVMPADDATVMRADAATVVRASDQTIVRPAGDARAAPSAAPRVDDTVVRAPARESASTTATATGAAPASPEAPASTEVEAAAPRRRLVGVLAAIGGLLLAIAIAVAVVVGGGAVRERPDAGATDPADEPGIAIPVVTVPSPVLVSAQPSADGSAVVFTVANPEPEDGDQLRWARAEQPGVRSPVDGDRIVVPLSAPGARVCIEAEIIRAGRASAAPLESCYPE